MSRNNKNAGATAQRSRRKIRISALQSVRIRIFSSREDFRRKGKRFRHSPFLKEIGGWGDRGMYRSKHKRAGTARWVAHEPEHPLIPIIPRSPFEKMVNGQKCLSARVRVIRSFFFFIRVIRAIRGCLLVATDGRS